MLFLNAFKKIVYYDIFASALLLKMYNSLYRNIFRNPVKSSKKSSFSYEFFCRNYEYFNLKIYFLAVYFRGETCDNCNNIYSSNPDLQRYPTGKLAYLFWIKPKLFVQIKLHRPPNVVEVHSNLNLKYNHLKKLKYFPSVRFMFYKYFSPASN